MAGSGKRGEVLVAIMNNHRDFDILQDQLWYRIPVAKAPRDWPPKWLAFYHTKVFGDMAYSIHYHGRVREIRVVKRRELFPNEPLKSKSEHLYFQVCLEDLRRLAEPIRSARPRRTIFIPTTWRKFTQAEAINDLFDDSPLEDRLWVELKKQEIPAERQWRLITQEGEYHLDFALFCTEGNVDVETDGDSWHAKPERIPQDNQRDNALESVGWHVLRFNGYHIRGAMAEYCMPKITKTIRTLRGLSAEGLVPRQFFNVPDGIVQQLTLLEEGVEYDLD
jgi:very-short-patch-repair endonuclease